MIHYKSEGYVYMGQAKVCCCVYFELPEGHTQDDLYSAESKALTDWIDKNILFGTTIKLNAAGSDTEL
jgi:hypothetical protein